MESEEKEEKMVVDCRKFGFKKCDKIERGRDMPLIEKPNFPEPLAKLRLVQEDYNTSIEGVYFFMVDNLREADGRLPDVIKLKDIFTASEQSAFWGQSQNRLSIQQGQVSNYLATIGKLIKELFQIVRELRILDERLELYKASDIAIKKSKGISDKKHQAAEITLRSYWVDLKDGGVKSPGSVYGLASTLGYTALPDLFFAAPPLKKDKIDEYVNTLKFNNKLKDVLRRKLHAYTVWKEFTYKEHSNRRNFTLKFLRQHYNSIQMYINWVKPYLRNVKRLSMNFEKTDSEDLIGAFEGSVTEIELVFCNKASKPVHPVVVLDLTFRTSPQMDYHQEGYQHKGPIHMGRYEYTLRGYTWTPEELANYIRMRESESMEILGDIDESLKSAIDALGDDLRNYLREEGEKFPEDIAKEEEEKKKAQSKLDAMKGTAEPFTAIFSGFKELFGAINPITIKKKDKGAIEDWQLEKARKGAAKAMAPAMWNTHKNFKKSRKMFTW